MKVVKTENVIKYIQSLDLYHKWVEKTKDQNFYLKKNYLYVDLTNKCNMNCKYCCSKSNSKKEQFNFDLFYGFFEMYLKETKIKDLNIMLSGGEITVLKPKIILEFISKILTIAKKYNAVINFQPISNLFKVSDEHFEVFKLIKEINKNSSHDNIFYTSSDIYHFPDGDFTKHIKNINRLRNYGFQCIVIVCITGATNEYKLIEKIKSDYGDIPIHLAPTIIYDDLEKNYRTLRNIVHCINTKNIYKQPFKFLPPLILNYSSSNRIVVNNFPGLDDSVTTHVKNIKTINDIYNNSLIKTLDFLFGYMNNLGDVFYYSKMSYFYKVLMKKELTKEQFSKEFFIC